VDLGAPSSFTFTPCRLMEPQKFAQRTLDANLSGTHTHKLSFLYKRPNTKFRRQSSRRTELMFDLLDIYAGKYETLRVFVLRLIKSATRLFRRHSIIFMALVSLVDIKVVLKETRRWKMNFAEKRRISHR